MKPQKLSPSLVKVVTLLNDGQFHDGTTMGHALSLTRSAVWKVIKKLESYGIEIHSVKGKGYALAEPCVLLDAQVIKDDIHIFEKLTSTNDYLKSFFGRPLTKPIFCIAEQQIAGRGRLSREWHSPFGQNIYLSCLYPLQKEVSELQGLSLAVSLAMIAACQASLSIDSLCAKWPNDILYHGEKLGGNLIELQAESHGSCCAVIGMGMNVNMLSAPKGAVTQKWTSLRKITGEYIDRNVLAAVLIRHLLQYLQRFEKHGLSGFLSEWRAVDYLFDRQVVLNHVTQRIQGIAKGIDSHGHLLMQLQDGSLQSHAAGETQILKSTA